MHRLIKRSITIVTTTVRRLTWYEPAQRSPDSPKAIAPSEHLNQKEDARKKPKSKPTRSKFA